MFAMLILHALILHSDNNIEILPNPTLQYQKAANKAMQVMGMITRASHSHRAVEPFATRIKMELRDQHDNLY